MSAEQVTYDLVLLLDPAAEAGVKQQVLTSTRSAIEAQGELVRHDEWGQRPLAYPIDRKGEAEYHLIQLHVKDVKLLDELDRTLRIADGVLRFMITKVKPGTPEPPQMAARARQPEADAAPAAAA